MSIHRPIKLFGQTFILLFFRLPIYLTSSNPFKHSLNNFVPICLLICHFIQLRQFVHPLATLPGTFPCPVAFCSLLTEHVYSIGRVLGDRNVLYKYVNPNLLAVMTGGVSKARGGLPLISLYLIDTVAGQIIHSVVHQRASEPTSLVVSENWVLVSAAVVFHPLSGFHSRIHSETVCHNFTNLSPFRPRICSVTQAVDIGSSCLLVLRL